MIRLRSLGAALFLVVSPHALQAQTVASMRGGADTVRVVFYNVLNYPGSTGSIRNPHFRTVIHTLKPDVLIVEEMISQAGSDQFLTNVMNAYQPGLYSTISFHNGNDTDCQLYYRPDKVTFEDANYIPTALRDIAEYKVTVNSTGDTLRLYGVHLKAGSTSLDEEKRLAETTILRTHLNDLPPGAKFVVGGDYNMRGSDEAAYQKLIGSEANNNGRVKDPINRPGTWYNNSGFKDIHTQSPRTRAMGDGGATGGMDDRFDIQLVSFSLDSSIVAGRYLAYGNDGSHFNDSINRLPNNAVPDSVANGLAYASDHLPLRCDYYFLLPSDTTPPVTFHVPVSDGWNLLSVPVAQADTPKTALFPTSVSPAFLYRGSYVPTDSVRNGPGFWLKFAADETVDITGRPLRVDTISVVRGWNIIGSISDSVNVNDVVSDPVEIIISPFFGHSGGYQPALTIVPGRGYWVKVNQQGKIILEKKF